jgi:hypothetical protein
LQPVQTAAPASDTKPSPQERQADPAEAGWNRPGAHSEQLPASPVDTEPGAQGVQLGEAAAEKNPGLQGRQVLAPALA